MMDNKKIEDAAKSLRKDFNDDVTQGFLVEFGFEKVLSGLSMSS